MTIEDTMVSREKEAELKRILEKIFQERCGLPAEVEFAYVPAKESRLRIQARKAEEEVAALAAAGISSPGEGMGSMEPGAGTLDAGMGGTGSGGTGAGKQKTGAGAGARGTGGRTAGGQAMGAGGQSSGGASAQGKGKAAGSGAGPGDRSGQGGFGSFRKGGMKSGFGKGEKKFGYSRKSDNPDVLFGKDFEDGFTAIDAIEGEMGEVTIRGKILSVEKRELRGGERSIIIFDVSDFTDTITVKLFARQDMMEDVDKAVVKGTFIKIRGVTTIDRFDHELTLGSIVGIKKCEDFTSKRMDTSLEKRVELHCHTKMSDMDGVSEVKDIIKRAKQWGMPAIAITDHGCVQAFTDANHALDKGDTFKIIYGVEGYLVDDLKKLVENPKGQSFSDSYVVFDIETTGFSPEKNKIIEIGAVKVEDGKITDKFSTFINPDVPIPFDIEQLTGINDGMVLSAPRIDVVLPQFLEFCRGSAMVAHNASFDIGFITYNARSLGLEFSPTVLDTVALARLLLPNLNRFKLDTVAKAVGVSLENHHRAVDDAGATAEIFVEFVKMLRQRDVETLDQLNALSDMSAETIRKLPTYHVIILAKNDVGRINLYRLVSASHLDYFARRPRIPKSLLEKYREGLIIGSACEAGELYQALLRGAPDSEIARLVRFYDYLEIQPLGNNEFMLRDEKSTVKSRQDLIDINTASS